MTYLYLDKRPLILVPCSSQKSGDRCQARDMYASQYFKSCRAYAEAGYGCHWYIMSAKYGLLSPTAYIDPYDMKLSSMSAPQVAEWALDVFDRIRHLYPISIPGNGRITILGGTLYRKRLVPYLRGYGYQVDAPFEGLGIGEQIQTMNNLSLLKSGNSDNIAFQSE